MQGCKDYKKAFIITFCEQLFYLQIGQFLQLGQMETVQGNLCSPHRFHDALFKAGADRHYFSGGLHLRSQRTLGINKFIKWPFRQFYNYIIKRRFKAGIGFPGYGVFDLIKGITNRDLGRHLGDRITGCLGSQRG